MHLMKRELVRDEGLRLAPYRCTAGRLTIGVGRNLDDMGITAEEADYLLENDIGRAMADLDRALPWWRGLSEARQRALANMCFNLGVARLMRFEGMLADLEAGDNEGAAREAMDSAWARQVGPRARRIAAMLAEG
ncbi:glycoside hydrolase family protein [Oleispirillum naphthae]|uniref:glycoside hydrolase family protein n=1 Tax=Oleispirillum naphthae TaxID=2838853 RepID=UPI0030823402